MVFSKSFPRIVGKSTYPSWEEIYLTEEEELKVDQDAKEESLNLMKESIEDAKKIIEDKQMKVYQSDIINMAISLFEKRASHSVYKKEQKAKEKFDEQFNN